MIIKRRTADENRIVCFFAAGPAIQAENAVKWLFDLSRSGLLEADQFGFLDLDNDDTTGTASICMPADCALSELMENYTGNDTATIYLVGTYKESPVAVGMDYRTNEIYLVTKPDAKEIAAEIAEKL